MIFLKNSNMNGLMEGFTDMLSGCFSKVLKTDIINNSNEYVVIVDIPGVKKEDINLSFENDILTISTSKDYQSDCDSKGYIKKERCCYSISRSYYLENGDENGITAKLEDGVLNIVIKKLSSGNKFKKSILIE